MEISKKHEEISCVKPFSFQQLMVFVVTDCSYKRQGEDSWTVSIN